jgi:DNA-binding SARP family transcriptional activator
MALRHDLDLRLLGVPAWRVADGLWQPLSRKDAALLCRLALEGTLPRSALATWLWPDVATPRAHANLRQRLYKLRQSAPGPLVAETDERLALGPAVRVDLRQDADAPEIDFEAPLLAGCDEPGGTDGVQAWLDDARRQWTARRTDLLAGLAARREEAGEVAAALGLTERLLALEPLLEHAWRRLMRLHALRGDRAGALAAFERCERTLRDELGVRPGPETIALMQAVECGAALPSVRPGRAGVLPPCPALLVGREAPLAALHARLGLGASPARPLTVVHGWPGVGKSMLLSALAHDRTWPGSSRTVSSGALSASCPIC